MWFIVAATLLAAPDLSIQLEVVKPLKVRKGLLWGALAVRLKNNATTPVTLRHRDVNGLRFVPAKGGPTQLLFHSCDCGFVQGLEQPPANRTVTLAPAQELVIHFDDFGCGGGAYRSPPKGSYTVTWQATLQAAQTTPPVEAAQVDLKECERLLLSEPGQSSPPVVISIQ